MKYKLTEPAKEEEKYFVSLYIEGYVYLIFEFSKYIFYIIEFLMIVVMFGP